MSLELEAELMEEGPLAPPEPAPVDGILTRIRGGETEAFEALMALTEMKVLGLAWRLLGDRDQARDAAQEVFLRIHRSLGTFRLGDNGQAWMYRITVNVCCDHARKRGPLMVSSDHLETLDHAQAGMESAEAAVLLTERRALVRQALGTLTPAERMAMVLRDLEGFATDEVARTLGVRPVTVRSQISSARAKVQVFCAALMRRSSGGLP